VWAILPWFLSWYPLSEPLAPLWVAQLAEPITVTVYLMACRALAIEVSMPITPQLADLNVSARGSR